MQPAPNIAEPKKSNFNFNFLSADIEKSNNCIQHGEIFRVQHSDGETKEHEKTKNMADDNSVDRLHFTFHVFCLPKRRSWPKRNSRSAR